MDAGTWFIQLNALQVMALGLVFFGGIYGLGGLAMSLLTRTLAGLGIGRPLDTRALKPDQLQREWRQSFYSILVFGMGMIVPWGFLQLGWAHLTPTAGAGRIALEILVLLIWNDVHFWLNHRLLHTKRLVRYHGDHHRSVVTTPWSTYSFHP
ncbi:MAG: desaturase, partial [Comamonas sp.]